MEWLKISSIIKLIQEKEKMIGSDNMIESAMGLS